MPLSALDARALDLDAIRIASPCTARWDEMPGDERVRFCGACRLHVYDTSHLTADEARTLIATRTSATLCLRLHRRADGTVITRDCPVGRSRRRSRLLAWAAAVLGIVAAGLPSAWVQRIVAGVANAKASEVPLRAPVRMVDMGGMAAPDNWQPSRPESDQPSTGPVDR